MNVTDAYLQECRSKGSALRDVVARTRFPRAFQECWGPRMLARPLFVPRAELAAAAHDVETVFGALGSLPFRAYGGDLEHYCARLGIEPDKAAVLRRFAAAEPVRYGRADLYHDGEDFKLLEFNVASDLGGTDRAEMQRSLLDTEPFGAFARRHGLDYVHTGEEIVRALHTACRPVAGERTPAVALICAPGGLARFGHLLLAFQEMLHRLGLPITLAELDDIAETPAGLTAAGRPVDAVFRFFTVDDVCADPRAARQAELVFRAHEEGRAVLWTPMDSSLYSNKGALSLLSDPEHRAVLTEAERQAVDRLLPWTRLLADGPAQAGGRTVDLIDHCVENRTRLIAKPLRDFGGAGIQPGWELSPRQWENALREGLKDHYIVQERVTPRAEQVVDPRTAEVQDWIAAWGLFVTPAGYAGTDVRASPADSGAIVNYGTNQRTRTTGVFTY
ncbi:hypothetical protein AB0M39_08470 [Streptomyces sp. NPDC051907]|uniref:hypothetical protein n=1 Tax=Streptomyces sp. NPDC051907 TaxID=3155284 RepID=UPI0034381311